MKKFIIIFIILAIIAGVGGYWYWQRNVFGKDNVVLEILGPREVTLAEEVEFIVRYRNIGHIRLDDPRLIFEFPEYVILEDGKSLRQEIGAEKLGIAIYPGEERTLFFRARLLGREGQALTARAALSFQPEGLEVRFETATTFTTIIESVPIRFAFDLPSEIEPGRDFRFQMNYFSNVDYPLLGLRIIVDYPRGFEFIKSTPRALEENEWDLAPLNKAEGGRIMVTGRIDGQIGEQRIFRAKLGMWREGEFILLKRIDRGVELTKTSLEIVQRINRQENHIASPGEHLHYEILFKNIGEETLTGLSLTATLLGEMFDLGTLNAPEGDFILGRNSITWDWRDVGYLQFLEPGEEGRVEFWLRIREEWDICLEGETSLQTSVFLAQVKKELTTKVNSKLEVSQRAFFQDEIFGNLGPLPPQVGSPTTYTIMWRAKNYYNRVRDLNVKAILPVNVELTGEIFPEKEAENFFFDSVSREIVWKVGEMEVGQGIINPAPNVSFQVVLTPDKLQRGKTPDLIGQIKITGEDVWTGQDLTRSDQVINTTLPDDPFVTEEMGIVQ